MQAVHRVERASARGEAERDAQRYDVDLTRSSEHIEELSCALESDGLDFDSVDVAKLKTLKAALKRCASAVDGLLAEKQFASLTLAPPKTGNRDAQPKVEEHAKPPILDLTDAVPPTADKENKVVAFKLGKKKALPRKTVLAAAAPSAKAAAQDATPPSAKPTIERAAPAAPPEAPAAVPRMPKLLVVIDTNELIGPAGAMAYNPIHYPGCTIVLPAQVAAELDGLKRSADAAVAARARQANALLSEAATRREAWLLCEPRAAEGGAELTADEKVLRCATDFAARAKGAASDRVLLATADRNLQLRAAAAHVEAMSLERARAYAHARHAAWRAAYGVEERGSASNAIAAAQWARRAEGPEPRTVR